MKHHLPKRLVVAIMSAITAVCMSLPQSFAVTMNTTLTTTFGNCDQAIATSVTTANAYSNTDEVPIPTSGITCLVSNTGSTVDLQTSGDAGCASDFLSPNTNVGNGSPWSMTINYVNANDIQCISGITLSVGLFNSIGNWQTSGAIWTGDVTFSATVTAGSNSSTYTGLLFDGAGGGQGRGEGKYAVTLTGAPLDLSGFSEYSVSLVLTETLGAGTFVGLHNIGYDVMVELPKIASLIWNGTPISHELTSAVWSDNTGSGLAYSESAALVFGVDGYETVSISENAISTWMEVQAGDYTFENSASLNVQRIAVGAGASLNLSGTGDYNIKIALVETGGAMTVAEGATLILNNTNAQNMVRAAISGEGMMKLTESARLANGTSSIATTVLSIENGAVLNLGENELSRTDIASFSEVILKNGSIVSNSQASTLHNLTVKGGDVGTFMSGDMDLNTYQFAGETRVDGTLTLSNYWNAQINIAALVGDGILNVTGNGAWNTVAPQTISEEDMVLTIGSLSFGAESFSGDLNINHMPKTDGKNDRFVINTGEQAVSFRTLSVNYDPRHASAPLSFNMGATTTITGAMTLNGGEVSVDGFGTLTMGGLQGGGALTSRGNSDIVFNVSKNNYFSYSGDLEVFGQIVKTGEGTQIIGNATLYNKVLVQEGTLVLAGSVTGLRQTIELQGGELNLSRAVLDVSNMNGISTTGYSRGQVEGNGFANLSGTIDVVSVGTEATLVHEGVQVRYNEKTFTMDASGDVTLQNVTDFSTLYVNVDASTESLSSALNGSGGELRSVNLGNNTKLAVDAAAELDSLVVRENASAGMELADNARFHALDISSFGGELTISGSGSLTTDSLRGGGALVFASEGEMIINGSNILFSGDVTVAKGTLKIGNPKALGEHNRGTSQRNTITIAERGTLDLNGVNDANLMYTMAGGTLTNSGNAMGSNLSQTLGLILTDDSTVHVLKDHDFRLLGFYSAGTYLELGNHTLYKTGNGVFNIRNTIVTDGAIEVCGGTFEFDTEYGAVITAADITFNGGSVAGRMNLSNGITFTTLQNTETAVAINANFNSVTFDGAADLIFGGVISNTLSICKTGEGKLDINSANSNIGTCSLNGGTLVMGNAVALGGSNIQLNAGVLDLNGNTIANRIAANGEASIANGALAGNVDIYDTVLHIVDSVAASGQINTSAQSRIAVGDGTLLVQGEGLLNIGSAACIRTAHETGPASLSGVDISGTMIGASGPEKSELAGVSITTMADYKLENVRLNGCFVDIGEDTTFFIKNVEISADTRITDGAARMFIEGGKAFLDESNTEASAPTMSMADVAMYRSGDTETWVTLKENVSLVSLTSELFTKVMLTGTDLWLDLTGLSAQVGDASAFSISFEDGALFDVDSLRVYATLNGEKYLDGYTTRQSGGAATLYFSSQIPELSTGTLSLLAMAALAGRRRRKRGAD